MKALKFLDTDKTMLRGLALPFGGLHNGRDLDGQYFSVKTNFCLDWFTDRPLLYHHGLDEDAGTTVVGRVKTYDFNAEGGWADMQLDRSHKFYSAIRDLVTKGKLSLSSGAMSHLVEENTKTGEITCWPWVEESLTPTPANLSAVVAWQPVEYAKAAAHFKAAGLILPSAYKLSMTDETSIGRLPDDFFLCIHNGQRIGLFKNMQNQFDPDLFTAAVDELDASAIPDDVKGLAVMKARRLAVQNGLSLVQTVTTGTGTAPTNDNEAGPRASGDGFDVPGAGLPVSVTKAARLEQNDQPQDDTGDDSLMTDPMMPRPRAGVMTPLSCEGSYEDIIDDLRTQANQTGPLATYSYTSIIATFPDCIIVCRHEYDEDDSDSPTTYWRVPYTLDDSGEPHLSLSLADQLDQAYVPVTKSGATALSLEATALVGASNALIASTRGLHERRVKEGRIISTANRQLLTDAMKAMLQASDALTGLLDATNRADADAAKAAYLQTPEALQRQIATWAWAAALPSTPLVITA